MDLGLAGKRVVITGGSKGIGLATAEALAAEGANLLLVARDAAVLEQARAGLAARHAVDVRAVAADVASEDGRRLVAEAVDRAGGADVLVNNAGAIGSGDLAGVHEQTWREGWDLKVYGFIFLTRLLLPRLAASSGVVVNVIGAASEWLPAHYIAGAVGNSALVAFTKTLAKSARVDGVRVVGVSPGPVATERLLGILRGRAAEQLGDAERWQELTASMPFGRPARPEEVADAVCFLASPRSGYTNGAVLVMDGAV